MRLVNLEYSIALNLYTNQASIINKYLHVVFIKEVSVKGALSVSRTEVSTTIFLIKPFEIYPKMKMMKNKNEKPEVSCV